MSEQRRVVFDCNVFLQALANPSGPAGRCVELALARLKADAKLVVSRDRDLLDLMDPKKPEAAAFQRLYPSLRILNPVGFLHEFAP
jgi:predicted nucleic acid-binding protein